MVFTRRIFEVNISLYSLTIAFHNKLRYVPNPDLYGVYLYYTHILTIWSHFKSKNYVTRTVVESLDMRQPAVGGVR